VSIAGYVLTLRGFLDKATQRVSPLCLWPHLLSSCYFKQLNVINVNFFTPCLLFSKVAFSLSSGMLTVTRPTCNLPFTDKLRELWIIPVFFILVSGVSLGVAWLLGLLFGLNPRQRYAPFSSCLPVKVVQYRFKKLRDGRCHDHELEFPPRRASSSSRSISARA